MACGQGKGMGCGAGEKVAEVGSSGERGGYGESMKARVALSRGGQSES